MRLLLNSPPSNQVAEAALLSFAASMNTKDYPGAVGLFSKGSVTLKDLQDKEEQHPELMSSLAAVHIDSADVSRGFLGMTMQCNGTSHYGDGRKSKFTATFKADGAAWKISGFSFEPPPVAAVALPSPTPTLSATPRKYYTPAPARRHPRKQPH